MPLKSLMPRLEARRKFSLRLRNAVLKVSENAAKSSEEIASYNRWNPKEVRKILMTDHPLNYDK